MLGPKRTLAALAAAAAMIALSSSGQQGLGAVSMGHANDGSLLRGVPLPARGTGYRTALSDPEAPRYGTEELVAAVQKIGADVARLAPGATLYVGDLSGKGGGRLRGHESHRAGRDVDLLFYQLDAAGAVVRPRGIRFDAAGRGKLGGSGTAAGAAPQVRVFDTRRNWLVLRSLIGNPDAHLQRVLVSEPLRALLLAHGRQSREPAWIVERASEVMCDSWSPHNDHFHVRLFCTAEDYRLGCRDEYPLYPWRRTELAGQGILSPELAEDPNRRGSRASRWIAASQVRRQWCP